MVSDNCYPEFIAPNLSNNPVGIRIVAPFGTLKLDLQPTGDYNISDVVGILIRPALRAAGFYDESIDSVVVDVYA